MLCACVRVSQGDQYDVREKDGERDVRNLGKPVELAARYFEDGADEVREYDCGYKVGFLQ